MPMGVSCKPQRALSCRALPAAEASLLQFKARSK